MGLMTPRLYLLDVTRIQTQDFRLKTLNSSLLHRYRFRQISWLVDVAAAHYGNVVGQ